MPNMLIKGLSVETDAATENVLMVTVQLQEIILVDTIETAMPQNAVRESEQDTSGVANTGTKSVAAYSGTVPMDRGRGMATFEIPLTGHAETFSIALAGTTYQLTVQYRNHDQGGWVLDIADATGGAIASGIPLVTGANLLEQYGYLGIAGGASLYVTDTAGGDAAPTFGILGTDTHLVLVTA